VQDPEEQQADRLAEVQQFTDGRRGQDRIRVANVGLEVGGAALRGGGEQGARVDQDEVWLYNAHIDEYSHGNLENHAPKAPRKLLLHRSEIRKIFELASVKGNALVALAFYWKNGKVKVSLGVGKGKQTFDKREDIKKRDSEREVKRATMKWTKGK